MNTVLEMPRPAISPSMRPLNACLPPQALWRGTLAGQLLYVPYTTVQFVTLQQARLAGCRWN